jgi:cytochrome b6-f complex iron-sulfur subunit
MTTDGPMLLDRRRFLVVLAGAAATTACGSDNGSALQFGDVNAGKVADVPQGSLQLVSGEPVALGRDSGGLYALTTTCTHQGCEVAPSGSGVTAVLNCPCHGSQFDRNGGVLRGPASAPLVHFAVTVDDTGNITIHGATRVDASTRTAPV